MTLGTNNMQATHFLNKHLILSALFANGFYLLLGGGIKPCYHFLWVTTKYNICTSTRHIRGNSHHAWATSLSNNLCLLLMKFSIQYLVLYLFLPQALGKML